MHRQIQLRELNESDEVAFLKWVADWHGEDLSWATFVWTPSMTHTEHLKLLALQKDRHSIDPNRVPSTMLYPFVNDEIVGRLNIRHELNDALSVRGGHLGYSVSPRHRGKGYGTEILRQGLEQCRHLGLPRVLLTCDENNTASIKVIENNFGELERSDTDLQTGTRFLRYWIQLEPNY